MRTSISASCSEIARGIPRSFPFHMASVQFALPVFAGGAEASVYPAECGPVSPSPIPGG
jgi:hypothetical protein